MWGFIPITVLIMSILSDSVTADLDINWGSKSAKCKTGVAKRERSTDAVAVTQEYLADRGEHIVGIFVTRFPEGDNVWSHKGLDNKLCKPIDKFCKKTCFQDARASYSSAGSSKANKPTNIQILMTSKNAEMCKFGYNVQVCFEKVK